MFFKRFVFFFLLIEFISFFPSFTYGQGACDPLTPSFIVNLAGKADSAWLSPNVRRVGICCDLDPNENPPLRCVEFILTLDTGAQGIRFDIASGAVPPGALGYQINCGPYYKIGADICLDGPGPHRLTFCEPGNNPNVYTIVSIPKPKVSPPVTVSDGCSAYLSASGYQLSTIQWSSVPYNAVYNSYLNCTSACSTVVATYQPGAPPYVDYQVSGIPLGGCTAIPVTKTTRVYFVNDKIAQILPQDPTICFGGTSATLTAYGTGGAPPYSYLWSTGETTQSINVGQGTFSVIISDGTSCPPASDTVTVTAFLSPITANAGPDLISCVNNPQVTINGSVTAASGGIWSGGTGTYSPSDTSLSLTYYPSASEIANGSVTLTLTTTGNGSCPPASDTVLITIVPAPVVNAGPDITVCANNYQINLNGSVTNAGGGTWTGGTGIFSPNANTLNAVYNPSASEISSGSASLTLTSTGNGTCLPVSDSILITITPAPTINAGPDRTVCANNSQVVFSATVTVATGGVWTGGTGAFSPNRNVLNPTYTPSIGENNSGSVLLTLTSTDNGNCLPASDNVLITITPAPVVNAGIDRTICANNASLQLNGSVTIASGGIWSGGTGSFSPSNTNLNATYIPSSSEITLGKATLTLTSTGNGLCIPVSDQMVITITPAPVVNAGPDQTVCANNSSFILNGTVTIATGGTWTGGNGTFSPNRNSLNAQYTPSPGEVIAGSVTFTLVSTGNGNCIPVSDDILIQITPAPTINAGPDQNVCANVSSIPLNGSVTTATGGIWKSSGTGTFSPNANTLNASYIPSASDKTTGSATLTLTSTGNGNCIPVSDNLLLTLAPLPIANAGPAQTVCADITSVSLSGSVQNATGGIWSTSGTGVFSPGTSSLNATYTLSSADKSLGNITLTLTTTGNGVCSPASSQKILIITPAPTVNAGPDKIVCSDVSTVQLNGTVNVATGGIWTTSGTGSFTPSASDLNANYLPSSSDKTAASITITLTSTGNGTCQPVNDNMVITITPAPTVNAGADQIICSDNLSTTLSGSVTIATGGTWSGGAGVFTPDKNSLTATYIPTSFEVAAGSVVLTLTSTGNGTCIPVKDDMLITINLSPIADAGSNQNLCGDVTSVQLNGTAQNATSFTWSTSGTGIFSPDNTTLNADYIPTSADTASHSVTLTLNVAGLAGCNPVSDNMTINFAQASSVNAGPDESVCENNLPLQLKATGSKSRWSGGSGTYAPNDSTLNASYNPTPAEINAGNITLTITTITNSLCPPVTDDVILTFIKGPIVNAGPNQTVCADTTEVSLNGSILNSSGGQWFTSGSGNFIPDAFTLNAGYIPSSGDISSGTIVLTLSSTGTTVCDPVTDYMILTITPAPSINAGFDKTVCADADSVALSGSVSVSTGGQWTSSGTGNFSPNDQTLNAYYRFSPADTAAQQVLLTLTSTGNGSCKPITDQVQITITPAPVISAGNDTSVCRDVNTIALNGLVANANGGIWTSSGNGTFSPTPGNTIVNYYPSASDKAMSSVQLTLTTTGNGNCMAVSDTIQLSFTPSPVVNAGPDNIICADSTNIDLSGSITVATGGIWSSSGSGSFSAAGNLNTSYLLSSADSATGSIIITLTSTGNGTCNPVSDDLILTITPPPTINAGSDITICADAEYVPLFATTSVASGGMWSSSGTGSFNPSASQLNTTYIPSALDTANGSVVLTIISTGNGTCIPVSDDLLLTILPAPQVTVSSLAPICIDAGDAPLQGIVYNAGGGVWSSSGSGSFLPDVNTLNGSYSPSDADKANGSVIIILTSTGNGSCKPSSSDTLLLQITPGPTANSGSNLVMCADADSIQMSGEITGAGGGQWTTSGTGIFSPDNLTLNAYYKPSPADTVAGNVILKLTTVNNGGCNPVEDSISLTITPAPSVNAGTDQTLCANVSSISLSGTVGIAGGGSWQSNGTGSYSPSSNIPNTSYNPTISDKTKILRFILTTTGNGTCKAVKDTMQVFFTPIPSVNAQPATVCADNSGASLNAVFVNATGVNWVSTGTGTFSPEDTVVDPVYLPSAADFTNSPITITVSTSGNGACPAATDNIIVTIKPFPIVNSGSDQTVCADNPNANLSGNIQNATGGIWSTSGTGIFTPDPTQMNVTYIPSAADINSGQVTIFLTTTGNGDCQAKQDTMILTITPAPTINAGTDMTVCPDQTGISLNGNITIASGGNWTTSASGTFTNNSSLQTNYNFSLFDYTSGPLNFILTSTGNGLCNAVKDTVRITFHPLPTADAGDDQFVCRDAEAVAFLGTITVASGATWFTSGTGIFSNTQSLLTKYYPSEADRDSGLVKIFITTNPGNTCKQVTDTAYLYITPIPVPVAGADRIVCVDTDVINLNGTVTSPGGVWSTSGTGIFSPDTTSLNASYTISSSDKSSGDVLLILSTTGNTGCFNTDTVHLTIYPIPDINLVNFPACIGDLVIINAQPSNIGSNNNDAVFTWYKDNIVMPVNTSSVQADLAGLYKVIYTLGSCSRTDSSLVDFNPRPVTQMEDRKEFCKETQPTVLLDAGQGHHYLWLSSGNTSQIEPVGEPGLYHVQVFNEFNCSSPDSIELVDICPPRVFVPTIFSPNHDGYNDSLQIFGKYYTAFKFTIFNRWGEIIFYTEDATHLWDGNYRFEPMTNGVYPWILYYEGLTEVYKGPFKLEGSITVDR